MTVRVDQLMHCLYHDLPCCNLKIDLSKGWKNQTPVTLCLLITLVKKGHKIARGTTSGCQEKLGYEGASQQYRYYI